MTNSIQFGSRQIDFELQYSKRKTLGITVSPDMAVLVKAPEGTSLHTVHQKVKKKAPWIIKQQGFFLTFHPKSPPKRFVNGETHLYLGRQYRLNVSIGAKESVKYKGRFIEVVAKNETRVKTLVDQWYRSRAKYKFAEIATPIIHNFKKYKVEPSDIILKEMATRWGSCTPTGKIILNPELIKAPRGCIEYVVTHELCHLIHHDHTNRFFDLQSREMPDWMVWKERLEALLA